MLETQKSTHEYDLIQLKFFRYLNFRTQEDTLKFTAWNMIFSEELLIVIN